MAQKSRRLISRGGGLKTEILWYGITSTIQAYIDSLK